MNFPQTRPRFSRPRSSNFPRGQGDWKMPRAPFVQRFRPPHLRPPFGMTPEGFQLPGHMQAPPMFGPRGATIPPRLMFQPRTQHYQDMNESNNWCETCDRGFKSLQHLETHKLEHQKCGIDGCEFVAHSKLVTLHIQMQHSTGLYNKIRNINTPEDIDNWIKERKKNYPSRENIEKKKAQHKECFERGEKLRGDKGRFNRNNKQEKSLGFKDKRRNDRQKNNRPLNKKNQQNPQLQKNSNKTNSQQIKSTNNLTKNIQIEEESHCNIPSFKGTSGLIRDDIMHEEAPTIIDNDIDIEDHEWQEVTNETTQNSKDVSVCSALGSLMTAYDSSSDEESNICTNKSKKNNYSITDSKSILKTDAMSIDEKSKAENIDKILAQTKLELNDKNGSEDSGPDEAIILKVDEHPDNIINEDKTTKQKRSRKRKHSISDETLRQTNALSSNQNKTNVNKEQKHQNQFFKRKIPKTLLEKLLEKDIQHERNVVLQCINYIVKKKFFDK